MSHEERNPYPGEKATPIQMVALAKEYRVAADALLSIGRRGEAISRLPYRLVAIHAVELYLNAFLLESGRTLMQVRALQHDLAKRATLALNAGLGLRKRTSAHLLTLSHSREYLAARYDPALSTASQINRLSATLAEVGDKVSDIINRTGDARGMMPSDRDDALFHLPASSIPAMPVCGDRDTP